MRKSKKVLNYVISGLAILYGVVLLFPQILFSNSVAHKNFKVYYHSDEVDLDQITAILDKSLILLNTSEVFNPEKEQKVFLCASFNEFTFFALRSRKAFAVNYPIIQNIFLTPSYIGKNEIKRNGDENNTRTLSGVIAHETIHSSLEDKLGLIAYKLLPTWKNEGYCDYVANETSYNEKLGWGQICKNKEKVTSPSFRYFKYKTYVQYILEQERMPLETFLAKDFNTESVAFKSRKAFCPNISE